jgi:hypothetical protein
MGEIMNKDNSSKETGATRRRILKATGIAGVAAIFLPSPAACRA